MTDVEGCTRRWAEVPQQMNTAMQRHHQIVHTAIAEHGGWRPVDQGEGDAVEAELRATAAEPLPAGPGWPRQHRLTRRRWAAVVL
ncbi:hypothetical protein SAMN06264364_10651 [Quadrisphaera granulorum]|uniref:Uncharacterized protein n=1 Tax=Quadrisphaera granulorum TaxID=317664 RepID=A0A316ABI2_9ACTN|nr:hypothetical protein [Quadrisphaera granulorum]PWJ54608.1 hypothetical protein BXY45_10651 [Quadrisphaera granulorum]SZE95970.1 hypothetical protein SAMN06264364_10651 [Quadrisphaera granulorum]